MNEAVHLRKVEVITDTKIYEDRLVGMEFGQGVIKLTQCVDSLRQQLSKIKKV